MTAASDILRERLGDRPTPRLAIVLGSGLSGVADAVRDPVVIPYEELIGFPVGSVAGHHARLLVGTLGSTPVAVMQGRAHLYEGFPPAQLAVPVRTMKDLGVETLLLTNASGSLRPDVGPGRLVALSDHINLMGVNPLVGENDDAVGPRFVGMDDAYDPDLRAQLHKAADALDVALDEGVYLAVAGPSFETPAEIRAFAHMGADLVGMSTVPETIVARHCGLRVAAVSCVTNLAAGMSDEPLTHEHTLAGAQRGADDLRRLLVRFAEDYR
jgi:inosine/guanosine/xanthosine phosphorylase family protein